MTESWNFQTSPYQRLKSNFRVSLLIPIFLALMCYTKIRKDNNKLSIIDLTLYSQSDHILGENSLQSVCKSVTILFSMWQEKLKIFMEWTVFSFIAIPISYFIIHVCNQKIDKHSEMTESWNFQTSPYQKLKSNFRVSHLIPIFFSTNVLHQDKKR